MRFVFSVLLVSIILTGCTKEKPTYEKKIEKMFLSPYRAECVATVATDKTSNQSTYTCQRFPDESYVLDYGDMKLLVNGETAVLEKDGIKVNVSTSEGELSLMPTYFFKGYKDGGRLTPTETGFLMEYDVEDTKYRKKAQMSLDKNFIPQKIHISDDEGKVVTEIEIKKYTD